MSSINQEFEKAFQEAFPNGDWDFDLPCVWSAKWAFEKSAKLLETMGVVSGSVACHERAEAIRQLAKELS